jgi:hypothetical protein
MRRLAIAALAAALVLPAAAEERETLSGEEIRDTVSGNTVEGSMETSGRYAEFYAADGTIRGDGYTGAWSVEGDSMCFVYNDGEPDCWEVGREEDQVLWIKNGVILGTGAVREGNPNDF